MCSSQALPYPTLFGAEFLSLEASLVSNYSKYVSEWYYMNHHSVNVTNLSFCNVSIAYTHPGQNDSVNVQVWLPLDTWNGRMQGIGGGGWQAGLFTLSYLGMTGAIGEGYVAVSTDGGHSSAEPSDWALLSPGNVDLYAIQNFASVSLNDAAIIGKSITQSFYGQPPKYSYWSGCSQGGRQGLMLAQRYPTAYDGIVASAPAINWAEFSTAGYYPQLIMALLGEYPLPCELDAITAAAISACDGDDGVTDGLISDPESCDFDPFTLVGTSINCSDTGSRVHISKVAAIAANASWTGARSSNGSFLWYGVEKGAAFTGSTAWTNTECSRNGTCIGAPLSLSTDWIRLFVEKDPSFQFANMTREEFDHIFHAAVQQFTSIIGTNDPDLSEFRKSGGKMLTYHGLADETIYPGGTRHYYNAVTAMDPDVHSFYRLFEVPGVEHCFGGSGPYPSNIFDAMVAWVEEGTVPDNLTVQFTDKAGVKNSRILCPYPQKTRYDGKGDPTSADSFFCSD
ncbi:hypothetical protein VTN77DRAFT_4504 [Rasamsonia byssochlamydoides]|uniref:uncharacterized protein n=1 Tax=Rasamsonia byssochlamydoides TaxID=89139 RepID=UPI0037434253